MVITVALFGYAAFTGGSNEAVSLNLYWVYALVALAIIAALFCAVYSMAKSSGGMLQTIITLVLAVVIIGVAYFYATGSTIEIPNIEKGGVFGRTDTAISEGALIVTYVLFGAAVVVALFSEIKNAFK